MAAVLSGNPIHDVLFFTSGKKVGVVVDGLIPIGTGFFGTVGGKHFFITAKHVLVPKLFSSELKISLNFMASFGEQTFAISFDNCFVDTEHDLAYLTVHSNLPVAFENLNYARFNLTQNYLMWGCPTQLTIPDGKGVRFRLINLWCEAEKIEKFLRLKVNYQVREIQSIMFNSLGGISGGPVFNLQGEVVAINKREVFTAPKLISFVDATFLKHIEFFKYKHVNPRIINAYELPLLIAVEFNLGSSKNNLDLLFNALVCVDDNKQIDSMDVWLSYCILGVKNNRGWELKVRGIQTSISQVFTLDFEYNLNVNSHGQKVIRFTDEGERKIGEIASETIEALINGATSTREKITIRNVQIERIDFEKFEDLLDSFPLYPQRHF